MRKAIMMIITVLTIAAPASAWANMIEGRISGVNSEAMTIGVAREMPGVGKTQIINLYVSPSANMRNMTSLQELHIGDRVKVDVVMNLATNNREARYIERLSP